jgi:hypothetical protein
MYVCMHVYMYVHTHTHTHIYIYTCYVRKRSMHTNTHEHADADLVLDVVLDGILQESGGLQVHLGKDKGHQHSRIGRLACTKMYMLRL